MLAFKSGANHKYNSQLTDVDYSVGEPVKFADYQFGVKTYLLNKMPESFGRLRVSQKLACSEEKLDKGNCWVGSSNVKTTIEPIECSDEEYEVDGEYWRQRIGER